MYLTYPDIFIIILLCLLITVFGLLIYNFFLLPERKSEIPEDIRNNLKTINELLDSFVMEYDYENQN
jgi:hypothetical protein